MIKKFFSTIINHLLTLFLGTKHNRYWYINFDGNIIRIDRTKSIIDDTCYISVNHPTFKFYKSLERFEIEMKVLGGWLKLKYQNKWTGEGEVIGVHNTLNNPVENLYG